jgi:hypothetical protein
MTAISSLRWENKVNVVMLLLVIRHNFQALQQNVVSLEDQ